MTRSQKIFGGAVAVAAFSLGGCASPNPMSKVSNDQNCTVKGSIRGSYGSLTPTGSYTGSFLCTHATAPDPAKVAEPPIPS